jgi:hypothetical protein
MGGCFLWAVLKNYRNSPLFWATFYPSLDDVFIFTKNGLGYILGYFFTSSYDRPG